MSIMAALSNVAHTSGATEEACRLFYVGFTLAKSEGHIVVTKADL